MITQDVKNPKLQGLGGLIIVLCILLAIFLAVILSALAAGRLVCRKLADGQAPALSREEVESCLTDTGL